MTGQMNEHMNKMQALHDRTTSATTAEERQKAIDDARKEMRDAMTAMKPMMGGGMMAQKGRTSGSDPQMQMMSKRMDMMQMMMQMMMDQQGNTTPTSPAAP